MTVGKFFNGFIFEDNLINEPSGYEEKATISCRVIGTNYHKKQVFLSEKHCTLDSYGGP